MISFYSFKSSITERLESNGIKIVYLDKKSGFDYSMIGKLRKVIKDEKPDIVHTHLGTFIYCFFAMSLMKHSRWVHTVHSMAGEEATGIRRVVQKYCIKRKKATPVALSKTVQSSVSDVYCTELDDVPVVFNGIGLDRCIQKENYVLKDKFTFIHIGRFSKEKNHIGLVRAFELFHKKYPDSKLQLLGTGPLVDEIKNYVRILKLTDSVEFLGVQDNVYSFLNEADVFVLPSFVEGIPMTLIEAMGTGLPIVATAVGGVSDMLENGTSALLCDVDEEKIAECFEKYYLDEQLREWHGKAALERSKIFSAEEMAKKYLEIYKGTYSK